MHHEHPNLYSRILIIQKGTAKYGQIHSENQSNKHQKLKILIRAEVIYKRGKIVYTILCIEEFFSKIRVLLKYC